MPKPKQSQSFVWVLLHLREKEGFEAVASSFGKRATTDTGHVMTEIPSATIKPKAMPWV